MVRTTMMMGLGLAVLALPASAEVTLQSRIKGAYFGSLVADALALSTHCKDLDTSRFIRNPHP